MARLVRLGITGLTDMSDLGARLNPPPADEYEVELDVMAEVRGYFKVTYKVRLLSIVFLPVVVETTGCFSGLRIQYPWRLTMRSCSR